jgi:hypothetical protein
MPMSVRRVRGSAAVPHAPLVIVENGLSATAVVMSLSAVKTSSGLCRSGQTRRSSAAPAAPSRCSTD